MIIAADVIYDDGLTEELFNRLSELLQGEKRLVLSIEKRINFTLEDCAPTSPAYDYFRTFFAVEENGDLEETKLFFGHRIPLDFPQYFAYERVDELELWEIKRNNSCKD